MKAFRGGCCFGWIEAESSTAGFDYLEFVPDRCTISLPKSYGGFSGGGLWQALLRRTGEGQLIPTELVLSGVAFYETSRTDAGRRIRCHGRESVYRRTLESLGALPNRPLQPTGKAGV